MAELKFAADESVESGIVWALREKYEVLYVDETMKGAHDDVVLQKAETLNLILITADKDFGELVYHRQMFHAGLILYRLHGLPTTKKVQVIRTAIDKYGDELLHAFTVITEKNIRIRKK